MTLLRLCPKCGDKSGPETEHYHYIDPDTGIEWVHESNESGFGNMTAEDHRFINKHGIDAYLAREREAQLLRAEQ